MTKRKDLEARATALGLTLTCYNPGSGVKIRIFEGLGHDWFDWHYIFATAGKPGDWKLATAFIEGYEYGRVRS